MLTVACTLLLLHVTRHATLRSMLSCVAHVLVKLITLIIPRNARMHVGKNWGTVRGTEASLLYVETQRQV